MPQYMRAKSAHSSRRNRSVEFSAIQAVIEVCDREYPLRTDTMAGSCYLLDGIGLRNPGVALPPGVRASRCVGLVSPADANESGSAALKLAYEAGTRVDLNVSNDTPASFSVLLQRDCAARTQKLELPESLVHRLSWLCGLDALGI